MKLNSLIKFENVQIVCRNSQKYVPLSLNNMCLWYVQLFIMWHLRFADPTVGIRVFSCKNNFNSTQIQISIKINYWKRKLVVDVEFLQLIKQFIKQQIDDNIDKDLTIMLNQFQTKEHI